MLTAYAYITKLDRNYCIVYYVAGPKRNHDKLWQNSMPCISDCVIAIGSSINNEILELKMKHL